MPLKGHRGKEARQSRLRGAAAPTRSPSPAQNHFRVGTAGARLLAALPRGLQMGDAPRRQRPRRPPPGRRPCPRRFQRFWLPCVGLTTPGASRPGPDAQGPRLTTPGWEPGVADPSDDCFRRLCPSARGRPPPRLDAHASTRRGGKQVSPLLLRVSGDGARLR